MAKHNAKGILSHYRQEEIGSKTNKNRILIQTRLSSASRTAAILMLNRQPTVLNILSNQDIGTQAILPPILKPDKDAKHFPNTLQISKNNIKNSTKAKKKRL